MNRLREAREYIGLSQEDAGRVLGFSAGTIDSVEAGELTFSPATMERVSGLYRRPVAWLKGEPASPVQITPEPHDLMEKLSDHDRSEVVAFAEFLQHGRKPHG